MDIIILRYWIYISLSKVVWTVWFPKV